MHEVLLEIQIIMAEISRKKIRTERDGKQKRQETEKVNSENIQSNILSRKREQKS